MATQPRTRRTFTVSFPAKLAEQVERIAEEESRTMSELFREAFRAYREREVRRVLDESNARGAANDHNGHREEEIEGFVHELRARRQAEKR
jgi:metal-responsive CopG/Arc/MetJ family transcriptional regulator